MRIIAGVVAGVAIAAISSVASGQTVTATGPGKEPGETLGASATFTVSNLDLIVTLSNTGTFDPVNANDILTAVFFTLSDDLKLTLVSAEVASGSSIIAQRLPLGFDGNVASQWAYRNDLVRAPNGTDEGISSTSLKWFGTKNLFSSEKIKGFGSFGGISFGITTPDDLGGHKRGNLKNQALDQDSVVFTFYRSARTTFLFRTFRMSPSNTARVSKHPISSVAPSRTYPSRRQSRWWWPG